MCLVARVVRLARLKLGFCGLCSGTYWDTSMAPNLLQSSMAPGRHGLYQGFLRPAGGMYLGRPAWH
ncbi:unnamed protein product [Ixodes persulcatus]